MFGKKNETPKLNFTPEITTRSFTKVSKLPVIPSSKIANYVYSKQGPGVLLKADNFMAELDKGKWGEVVGVWTDIRDSRLTLSLLNREGDFIAGKHMSIAKEPDVITPDLKANLKYGGGTELENYALVVGPDVPLSDIIASL